jgi:hypothetical protein
MPARFPKTRVSTGVRSPARTGGREALAARERTRPQAFEEADGALLPRAQRRCCNQRGGTAQYACGESKTSVQAQRRHHPTAAVLQPTRGQGRDGTNRRRDASHWVSTRASRSRDVPRPRCLHTGAFASAQRTAAGWQARMSVPAPTFCHRLQPRGCAGEHVLGLLQAEQVLKVYLLRGAGAATSQGGHPPTAVGHQRGRRRANGRLGQLLRRHARRRLAAARHGERVFSVFSASRRSEDLDFNDVARAQPGLRRCRVWIVGD